MAERRTVRAPLQERSRRTLNRLLDAAEAMIEDSTFERATVPAIARRGRSSVGSFYARFESKEALLGALFERFHDRMLEAARTGFAEAGKLPASLDRRVPRYVTLVVEFCRAHRGVFRARLIRNLTQGESVPERQIRKTRAFVRLAREFFAPCRGEIAHRDPDRAIDFALQMVDSIAAFRILATGRPIQSFKRVTDRTLIEESSRAMLEYLSGSAHKKSARLS